MAAAVAVVLVGVLLGPHAHAAPPGFIPFGDFLSEMRQASYATALAAGKAGAVRDAAAFAEMRTHVLQMYDGVRVRHSYLAEEGYFDCVTVESQPSLKALGGKPIATPPTPAQLAGQTKGEQAAQSPLLLGDKDAFGNAISCPQGTIPMKRITMERLGKFATLKDFLAKTPHSRAQGLPKPEAKTNADPYAHHYAVGYQFTAAHGGQSSLALYNPAGPGFSLSQQWYLAGGQSVEGGWVKYSPSWGDRSVTFIYFTADNYVSTGCYNLDCPGFVQINGNWPLGGGWSAYSVPGGAQYQFTLQWKWYAGNWWMFLQGAGALEAVGYYPGYLYNGGPLSYAADLVEYGGEVANVFGYWPPMGSGNYAASAWPWTAYQHTVFYISTGGPSVWSSLGPIQTVPGYYTFTFTPASAGWNWGSFLYFGGPGGP